MSEEGETSRRVVMTRTLRSGQQDDGHFDLTFWRKRGT